MIKKTADTPIKPQVIDLDPEDISMEEPAPSFPPPPPSTPQKRSGTLIAWLIPALLVGAAVGGWVYKDVLSAYIPSNEMLEAKGNIESLQAQSKTFAEQVAAISAESGLLKTQIDAVASEMKSSASANSTFDSRVAAAEAATTATRAEIEKLKKLPLGGGAVITADSGALASLAQRLDTVEKDVASLKTMGKPSDQSALATTLSQSMSDLQAKIAAGTSYRAEFDRVSRMVPAAAGLDTLGSHADEGLPTTSGLAKELTDLIPLLPKPEVDVMSPDGSYTDGFWNMMKGLITIRKLGEADWPNVAAQCAALAESGDLAQAIGKIDSTEGTKPIAISNWRDRAAARLALESAVEETSKAVSRQVTSLGATP
jgi:hypothetical protein